MKFCDLTFELDDASIAQLEPFLKRHVLGEELVLDCAHPSQPLLGNRGALLRHALNNRPVLLGAANGERAAGLVSWRLRTTDRIEQRRALE